MADLTSYCASWGPFQWSSREEVRKHAIPFAGGKAPRDLWASLGQVFTTNVTTIKKGLQWKKSRIRDKRERQRSTREPGNDTETSILSPAEETKQLLWGDWLFGILSLTRASGGTPSHHQIFTFKSFMWHFRSTPALFPCPAPYRRKTSKQRSNRCQFWPPSPWT